MLLIAVLSTVLAGQLPVPAGDSSPDTLDNGQFRAVITPVGDGSRAGSVLELIDLETGTDFAAGGDYASVHCGDFVPQDGALIEHSPTRATFVSVAMVDPVTRETLPVTLMVDFRLVGRGMEVSYTVTTTGTVEFTEPLEAVFGLSPYLGGSVRFANQTVSNDRTNSLDGQHTEVFRVSGDQEVHLYGGGCPVDMTYMFPNPAKGLIGLSREAWPVNEHLILRFFDVHKTQNCCVSPELYSRVGPGNTSTYYVRMAAGDANCPVYFSNHPHMWERTASWILDDIPLVHPGQGDMWSFSVDSSGPEIVTARIIQLLQEHPSMNMNIVILADGILAENCDSMWFEPGYEDSWSHWHSTWRIATEAPDDYMQWMCNIQNDVYPWADRVNLGCHGYHHTPNPDSCCDPHHEFITLEFAEHQERFDVVFDDFTAIGLDAQEAMRAIRPPGNKTSLSGLWAMVDHGFRYFSNGTYYNDWVGGEWFWDLFLTRYETPGGLMWGANTVWRADWSAMMEYEKLSAVMERGKHGLLHGHPIDMFASGNPAAYHRMDSVCTSLEEDYSNFGWVMPLDYAHMLDECYALNVDSIRWSDGSASIYFNGSTSQGQTVVCRLPADPINLDVRIDGEAADWEQYEGYRIFVDADGLPAGSHVVLLEWDNLGVQSPGEGGTDGLSIAMPNPCGRFLSVTVDGLRDSGSCRIDLLDMAGRRIVSERMAAGEPGSAFAVIRVPPDTPPGVYLVWIRAGELAASRKLVLLNR